jgi:hypothetical protein
MSDYFELDFLSIDSKKSADAIPIRYKLDGTTHIHLVDGGFQDTGELVISHINKYYGKNSTIDAVIVTHPDGDHAGGLRKVLEEYSVNELWMLRPWMYAEGLIERFSRFKNVENLIQRLKEIYPNIAALEELAESKGIPISEPLQGATIGHFTVLSPTKELYLDLIVESDKTPKATKDSQISLGEQLSGLVRTTAAAVVNLIKAAWGSENFPEEGTSPENEMSVVQYANLCGKRILLTGDAGRRALAEAADFTPSVGIALPGLDRVQIPHHGSRHNVSSEILDLWLGTKLNEIPAEDKKSFHAVVSASKDDDDHPRKAVLRGFMHRGGSIITTENGHKRMGHNAPDREGWVTAEPVPYPEDQEE